MRRIVVTLMVGIVSAGCATPGINTFKTVKHNPNPITNEIVVNQPYGQVWDKLVRELSKSFYVINNIDKESRIINISFSSQSPSDFVDCGETHRTYTHNNKKENFNYKIADSSTYKYATGAADAFSYYVNVRRSTSLEGRSNVYLAPLEGDLTKTKVAVNTRYILTINATGERYAAHINGNIFNHGALPYSPPILISFNTLKPTEHDFGDNIKATCFATGKLEQEVLQTLQQ